MNKILIISVILILFHRTTNVKAQCVTYEQYYHYANKLYEHHNFNENAKSLLECYQYFYSVKDYGYAIYSLNFAAYLLLIEKKIIEAKTLVDQALHDIQITKYENVELNTDLMYIYSQIYYDLGNPELSISYAEKYLNLYNKFGKCTYSHHVIFQNLGYCNLIIGDYNKSLQYFKKAIRISPTQSIAFRTRLLGEIASVYLKLFDLKNAKLYLNLSIESQKKSNDDYDKVFLNNHLANYHLEIDELDSAQYYTDQNKILKPRFHQQVNLHQLQGKVSLAKNDNLAEHYFKKAISISRDSLKHNRYKTSQVYLNAAKAFGDKNKSELAIEYLDNSIISIWDDYGKYNKIDDILNHRLVSEALLYKSILLAKQAKYNQVKKEFDTSLSVINYLLKSKITSWESSLNFSSILKTYHSKLLSEAVKAKDFNFAFKISQSIHAILLKLKLNETKANKHFGLETEKLDSINNFKIKISEKRTLLLNSFSKQHKDSIESIIFNNQRKLDSLISVFETSNPAYYKLKYSSPPPTSIKSIQKNQLSKNSALIEYFMGEDNLYTFIITKNDLKVLTTEIDSNLTKDISVLNSSLRSLNADFNTFTSSSTYLYNFLLKEPLQHLGPSVNKLYIIPDNEISYVPFEVLINEVPQSANNSRYDLLPYLVKDYSISYHYSSALLDSKNTSLSENITGFAPSFTSSFSADEDLESLLYNKNEVLIIKDITDGQINIDSSANLKNLKESVNQYRIAHLATHATCNDSLPFESKIYFEDGPLHAYEIYNMPHKLDLAVLSACETGTGALKKGEGLMSLARAFISSGCQSVITSLWNVNDQKSVEIMKQFYTHLYKGKPVGRSLTEAKRDYLENVNSVLDAHPYHWATFITVGNADMAIPVFPWTSVLVVLTLLLICWLTYIFFQKSIKKS